MRNQWIPIFLGSVLFLVGAGCALTPFTPEQQPRSVAQVSEDSFSSTMTAANALILPPERIHAKQARIATEHGDIIFELFDDTAPLAVSNFVALAERGYFDGLTFHRRDEGFVIQGGDPNGNGTGGPGYDFADELNDDRVYTRGIVAMANRGANTNGSQFFIMLADTPNLPKKYTIFGNVIAGMDVVDQIAIGDVMSTVVIEPDSSK